MVGGERVEFGWRKGEGGEEGLLIILEGIGVGKPYGCNQSFQVGLIDMQVGGLYFWLNPTRKV